jgi:hypothetical protein
MHRVTFTVGVWFHVINYMNIHIQRMCLRSSSYYYSIDTEATIGLFY